MIKLKNGVRQQKGGGLMKNIGKRIIYKNYKPYLEIVCSIDMKYLLKDGNRLGKRKSKYIRNLYDKEINIRIQNTKNGKFLTIDEIVKEKENQENQENKIFKRMDDYNNGDSKLISANEAIAFLTASGIDTKDIEISSDKISVTKDCKCENCNCNKYSVKVQPTAKPEKINVNIIPKEKLINLAQVEDK